jgi:Tol biopolymer transport system component
MPGRNSPTAGQRTSRAVARVACALAVFATVSTTITRAHAAFPGADGRIAFVSERTGTPQIYSIDPDGTKRQQLTFARHAAAMDPFWAPDGTSLLFTRSPFRQGSMGSIWSVDADGSNAHELIGDDWFHYQQASYSPDGSTIVFSRCYPNFRACDLMTADADGTNRERLTTFGDEVYDLRARYSPDGSQIAFSGFGRDGVVGAAYVMDADGSNITRVTRAGLGGADPDWSPDGSSLLVRTHCCPDQPNGMATLAPDGSGLTTLVSPATAFYFGPTFSPSGSSIVVERDSLDFSHFGVWVTAADGSNMTRLAARAYEPAWGSA